MKHFKALTILFTLAVIPAGSIAATFKDGCTNDERLPIAKMKDFNELSSYMIKRALASEIELKPFFTDGCTMFIDGTKDQPTLWRNCCVEHDLRYWFGGSSKEMDDTDLRLKSCVTKVAGAKWAKLIYMGVRTGHHSPIKNKTQWNWGWSKKRNNAPLNPDEISYVKSELEKMDVPEVNMDEFLKVNFP